MSINPVAFLVVQENNVKLMPVDHSSCVDRLLDYVPDLMQKLNDMLNKKMSDKEDKTNKEICDLKSKKCKENNFYKEKSAEVQGQEQKINENEKNIENYNVEVTESDGEIFGEE